jgi:hypothetical protein
VPGLVPVLGVVLEQELELEMVLAPELERVQVPMLNLETAQAPKPELGPNLARDSMQA